MIKAGAHVLLVIPGAATDLMLDHVATNANNTASPSTTQDFAA